MSFCETINISLDHYGFSVQSNEPFFSHLWDICLPHQFLALVQLQSGQGLRSLLVGRDQF